MINENTQPEVTSGGSQERFDLPSDLETRLRNLLGRLTVEAGEEKKLEVRDDYEVSLSGDEVELLEMLSQMNKIQAPEGYIPHGSKSSPRNMTSHGHSMLLKSFRTPAMTWPINVCFKNLTFHVTVPEKDPGITTIGKSIVKIFKTLLCLKGKKKDKLILNNLSGVFKAGTMTVVLGPPGSGFTTLFKALSDILVVGAGSKLTGDVLYSGYDKTEVIVRKLAAYIDQLDIHTPTLTVEETLDFAYKCFGGDKNVYGEPLEKVYPPKAGKRVSMKLILQELVPFTLRQYGLVGCKDTIVGNEILRGVSGGERHRVTSCELVVGQKPLMFFDQMSTGLDSAATYDICKDMRTVAKDLDTTYVFSLLQPAPEVYNLFDEVLILADGLILFHDKRENVLPFFESIGYKCPPTKDIADFVQEVTTDLRTKYTDTVDAKTAQSIPKTNAEIASAWQKSKFAEYQKREVEKYSSRDIKIKNKMVELVSSDSSLFCTDFWQDFKLVFARQTKLFYRNKPFLIARIVQCTIMSMFLGTVFYDLPTNLATNASAIQQRFGIIFFVCLQSMLAGFALVPHIFETREVFYKQRRNYMHRVFTYVASALLVGIPMQMLESFLLATMSFWLSGVVPRSPDAPKVYFGMIFFMMLLNMAVGGITRMLASVSPNREVGFVFMGFTFSTMILFSGFIITHENIPPWFIWIYWISPIAYTIRSVCLMVFKADVFSDADTEAALDLFSIQDDTHFIWYGAIYLIGIILLNLFGVTAAMTYVKFDATGKRREVIDQTDAIILANAMSNEEKEKNGDTDPSAHPNGDHRVTSSVVGHVLRSVEIVPVTLVFKDLWYTLPPNKTRKEPLPLLRGITGYARPGVMTALMGSSGAGKTTLMDVIAGRKTEGKIDGQILVNGLPKTQGFAGLMGYVEQMDVHSPHQTVEEAVYFSAHLRQPKTVSKEKLNEFVKTILDTLELTPLSDFEVGVKSQGGLSVEQAKRLTIAVELAANPSVLFCDEPTSGLDSRAAEMIMRGIKKVAKSGRTVVCTIHQPNRSIFESFDRILLLQKGGRMVFFGDLGIHSKNLVDYFESIPGTNKIPDERYNPANYMLEVIGAGTSSVLRRTNKTDYVEVYSQSELKKKNDGEAFRLGEIKMEKERMESLMDDNTYHSSIFTQQKFLLIKTFRTYWRHPMYNLVRYVFMIIMALLWGFTYWRAAKKTGDDFQASTAISIIGVIFNSMVFIGAVNLNLAIPCVSEDKGPYMRERASMMYRALPYSISWTIVELPYQFMNTLTFCSLFYFMIGLEADARKFFTYWGIFSLYVLQITYFGHMLISIFPHQQVASIVAAMFISLFALFAGFLIAIKSVAPFWKFMTYIVPTRYALNAMATVLLKCNCDSQAILAGECVDSSVGCKLVDPPTPGVTVKVTAWEVLQSIYGFEERLGKDVMALVLFAVVFRIFTFLGYAYLSKVRR